ncbi:GNAT family N-acetyltransferase [Iodobacter sp.]|uniref:GNAT family N-acetyltransferase n=1 Tax=Iodobacter sp. TaxID=1915058 RepID=UPI0025E0D45D|nr:GNAT family protein [Iodobacter sp.]
MPIYLSPIQDLTAIALDKIPEGLYGEVGSDALLPSFVAVRALAQLALGVAEQWARPFHLLRKADHAVVGSCGFKGAPINGQVEIGYAVATSCRQQGFASAAVRQLLLKAFLDAEVSMVVAQVDPNNTQSTQLVKKLGFTKQGSQLDMEGDLLVQWVFGRADVLELGAMPRA